jgi:hypothetical protein
MSRILFVVAHGENWEVAASHAVGDLVKKIIDEQSRIEGQSQEKGTFSLKYKPSNSDRASIIIPLSTPTKSPDIRVEDHPEQETKQVPYFEKVENGEA